MLFLLVLMELFGVVGGGNINGVVNGLIELMNLFVGTLATELSNTDDILRLIKHICGYLSDRLLAFVFYIHLSLML
jgi:hypothetical protein